MLKKDKAGMGFLKMFPTCESFYAFKDDGKIEKALKLIFKKAHNEGIIAIPTENSFLSFIKKYQAQGEDSFDAGSISFSEVLDIISGTMSIKKLVAELNKFTDEFSLPAVQESLVSRIRNKFDLNTPKKRFFLRLLAYWVGVNKPESHWNYEKLLKLSSRSEQGKEKNGILLVAKINPRDSEITGELTAWLQSEILKCISDLSSIIRNKDLIISSVFSVSLNISKSSGDIQDLSSYKNAIRSALSIAHQILIRWTLSPYATQNDLVTGIYAGEHDKKEIFLHEFLCASHYGFNILVTDFARLCAQESISDLVFEKVPLEKDLSYPLYELIYFSIHPLYFVQPLFNMIPHEPKAIEIFRQELTSLHDEAPVSEIVSKINRFPTQVGFLLEIARICLYRRMFREADIVLSGILKMHPRHALAKMMRAMVYNNLSLSSERAGLFQRVSAEGEMALNFFEKDPELLYDEVYVTLGLLYYGHAKVVPSEVVMRTYLERAKTLFCRPERNIICLSLYLYSRILESNEKRISLCELSGADYFSLIGWKVRSNNDYRNVYHMAYLLFQKYLATHAEIYHPGIKQLFCCLLWDFIPNLTVSLCSQMLIWLEEAKEKAEELGNKHLSVYSLVEGGVFQSAPDFIRQIELAADVIKSSIPEECDSAVIIKKPDKILAFLN